MVHVRFTVIGREFEMSEDWWEVTRVTWCGLAGGACALQAASWPRVSGKSVTLSWRWCSPAWRGGGQVVPAGGERGLRQMVKHRSLSDSC
jgi:hypothetical protein